MSVIISFQLLSPGQNKVSLEEYLPMELWEREGRVGDNLQSSLIKKIGLTVCMGILKLLSLQRGEKMYFWDDTFV